MKPKLKPVKPYKYRVILSDKSGNFVHDDVARIDQILPLTGSLIKELKKKGEKEKNREGAR
ncbi:hypothetical protein ES708_11818 [subsurface metagenome]